MSVYIRALLLATTVTARYNILSLDSAKYEGYMTARFVDYMEQYAYVAAVRDKCMPARDSGRVAMPELFDMLAGSETGAIIASSLAVKNPLLPLLRMGLWVLENPR